MPDKITACIWYDLGQARAAAEFYVSLGLPDSHIDAVHDSPADNPRRRRVRSWSWSSPWPAAASWV